MTIRDPDFSTNTVVDNITTERIKAFVYTCIAQDKESPSKRYSDFNDASYAKYLTKNSELNNQIKYYLNTNILPASYFQWITDSHYQYCWIKENIGIIDSLEYNKEYAERKNVAWNLSMYIPPDLKIKTRSLAIIDYLYFYSTTYQSKSIYNPLHTIKTLGELWLAQKKNDKIFEWLQNKDVESKIKFFRIWLGSRISPHLLPTSSINTYEQLLTYFLRSNFSAIEKQALSTNARKIWNQQKTREKNIESKQCNFILKNETISKLIALSKKYEISRTEIIESIIDSEFKHEIYIKEKINRRKLINAPLSDQDR
jgi:hypothetical protein